jgi:acetyl-CoA carboxylase carboxyl transferase subunit beta
MVFVAISVRNPSRDQRRLFLSATRALPFEHLIDDGSFEHANDDLVSSDPIGFPDYAHALETSRTDSGRDESVSAGAASVEGRPVEIAGFDFTFLGGSMGEVAGERIARSMERALERKVPFILRSATGGARMQEGMRSLVQMPKLVAARAALADGHLPFVAVLGDPSTGGVLASVAALADVILAESGATVGFAGPRVVETVTGVRPSTGSHTAASALSNGLIDQVVDRTDARAVIGTILTVLAPDEPDKVGTPPEAPYRAIDPWAAVAAARSPERSSGAELATAIGTTAVALRGDRGGYDDKALFAALTRVHGRRVLVLALDRASLPGPGAYRKARRCLALATRLELPVVTLIDTPGADPSEISEAGGIAWEIAALFEAMLAFPHPVISVVTGEGGSGGALAFAAGDILIAFENSIFSVIGPQAAAAILWRDPTRAADAARALKLTSHELKRLGIADSVVAEPLTGSSLAQVVAYHLDRKIGRSENLVVKRRQRWRDVGTH